jgi:hypothetical protein
VIFDGRFVGNVSNYRAYRFPWSGQPRALPAVAAARHGATESVYASWNGATGVAGWRVLAGSSAKALRVAGTARKRGFETGIRIPTAQRYVAVQALDAAGRTLATSATVRAR